MPHRLANEMPMNFYGNDIKQVIRREAMHYLDAVIYSWKEEVNAPNACRYTVSACRPARLQTHPGRQQLSLSRWELMPLYQGCKNRREVSLYSSQPLCDSIRSDEATQPGFPSDE